MGDWAIRVEGLGKKYNLVHRKRNQDDTLIRAFATGLGNLLRKNERTMEEFWALRNVGFTVNAGDRVGIIGRNGAGKSTLLKIMSRVVKPTTGRIEYNGRMASLLEVGTGFHGDLTGRENIFLNGSILGMTRSEIGRKFDEIVAFSEIEQFLDTPVKRYSSGMYVRLAFAVAAHLEPDILIVDEVLAVGDAAFQKKCIGQMDKISREGRTLFFVSHNMATVQNLCNHCLYLDRGHLEAAGPTAEVIGRYLSAGARPGDPRLGDRTDRSGRGQLRFVAVRILDHTGRESGALMCGADTRFQFDVEIKSPLSNLTVNVGIDDQSGNRVLHFGNDYTGDMLDATGTGKKTITLRLPKLPLRQGKYSFTLYAATGTEVQDWVQSAGTFTVEAGDFYGTGRLPPEGQASVFVDHQFRLE